MIRVSVYDLSPDYIFHEPEESLLGLMHNNIMVQSIVNKIHVPKTAGDIVGSPRLACTWLPTILRTNLTSISTMLFSSIFPYHCYVWFRCLSLNTRVSKCLLSMTIRRLSAEKRETAVSAGGGKNGSSPWTRPYSPGPSLSYNYYDVVPLRSHFTQLHSVRTKVVCTVVSYS